MSKQRIQILVEPEMLKLLRDLSSETGQPLSPMINSLLESLAPGLQSTLTMARLVKQMDQETKSSLQNHLGQISETMKEEVFKNMEKAKELIKTA